MAIAVETNNESTDIQLGAGVLIFQGTDGATLQIKAESLHITVNSTLKTLRQEHQDAVTDEVSITARDNIELKWSL